MDINVLETLKSSFVMMILFGCSVVALTFLVERWLYLRRSAINAGEFFKQIRQALARGGMQAAVSVCAASPTPLAAVVRGGLESQCRGPKAVQEIMDAIAMEERAKLEKNLGILGTLGNIAPLIGLFGTVLGIIHAFHAMAVNGSAGPSVISAGIAEALLTTAAGLMVAVPAVVAYNFFLRRVHSIMTDIDAVAKKVGVLLSGSEEQQEPVNGYRVLPEHITEITE
jgi:biopolymer transport protein ExbB/TolQ